MRAILELREAVGRFEVRQIGMAEEMPVQIENEQVAFARIAVIDQEDGIGILGFNRMQRIWVRCRVPQVDSRRLREIDDDVEFARGVVDFHK